MFEPATKPNTTATTHASIAIKPAFDAVEMHPNAIKVACSCLLYTSDAADE